MNSKRKMRKSGSATTTPARQEHTEPPLPHEADQSSGSQVMANEQNEQTMRQAAADLENGLVDTDRGSAIEPLKRKHFPAADTSTTAKPGKPLKGKV